MPNSTVVRTRLVLESAILLTLAASVFGFEWLKYKRDEDMPQVLVLLVPVTAAIVFVPVGLFVRNLIPTSRMRWPLPLTLPVVYGAILQLCAALWKRGPNPLVKHEVLNHAGTFWQRMQPALALLMCQIAVFAVWSVLSGRVKASE